ncbi:NUDIX domain-containing protein [Bauldia sp.]|uniref:NUDIX domain-containing protein n=1 Tax=Bauldia sp. TaxID=2575872 RepID=UPI003BA94A5B
MSENADEEPAVRVVNAEVLADDWATLTKYTIDYRRSDGARETLIRQVYDRGDGAAILPYDPDRGTVLLVRQFRMPVFLKAPPGWLIEVCAGLLDDLDPEAAIRREAREELGYDLSDITMALDVFMSPGSVSERLALFVARYSPADRVSDGGGAQEEGEDIEVLEVSLDHAMGMIADGTIRDAKTVILLQHLRLKAMTRGSR